MQLNALQNENTKAVRFVTRSSKGRIGTQLGRGAHAGASMRATVSGDERIERIVDEFEMSFGIIPDRAELFIELYRGGVPL